MLLNISNKFAKFFDVLRSQSVKSSMNSRLAACVLYKGKISSCNYNDNNRTSIMGNIFYSVHAEMGSLADFSNKVCNFFEKERSHKIDLLVVRYSKDGRPKNSKPCSHCLNFMRTIVGVVIKKVYYFNESGEFVVENLKDMKNCFHTKVCKQEAMNNFVKVNKYPN